MGNTPFVYMWWTSTEQCFYNYFMSGYYEMNKKCLQDMGYTLKNRPI